MATARKPKILDALPPELTAEVERAVRAAGALPAARLSRAKLGPGAQAELEWLLTAAGLERAGKVVRVPLAEQLAALLRGGAHVALKDVPKRVKGGARKEIDAAIDHLLRSGAARLVVRTQVEVLVGDTEQALAPTEVAALVKAHAALGKVLKKVTARGRARSILRADLDELLAPIAARPRPAPNEARRTDDAAQATSPANASLTSARVASASSVASALARLEHPSLKLVRIPDLVRALDGELPLEDVHRALLAAAEAGEIELRPEAGGEFLSQEDARLCPPGPRGTVFSYARRVTT